MKSPRNFGRNRHWTDGTVYAVLKWTLLGWVMAPPIGYVVALVWGLL